MGIMKTKLQILVFTAAVVLVSGCATVDISEMTSPVAAKAEAPAEKNIVLRAARKLFASFQSKGFIEKTSRKKMQSAASILLNGLEERELTSDVSYKSRNLPRSTVVADIVYASQQVSRTANAAEVYFELSEGKRKLKEELVELEQALIFSREASVEFESIVGSSNAELQGLNVEVERLKLITDNFGRRVRDQAAADLASRRQENS